MTVKTHQREDFDDRETLFSEELRNQGIQATDIDFICGDVGNDVRCGVMLEVTLSQLGVLCDKYLEEIDARRARDHNDYWAEKFARLLMVPAYLVVYDRTLPEHDSIVWVRSIDGERGWAKFTKKEFFGAIREFCRKTRLA